MLIPEAGCGLHKLITRAQRATEMCMPPGTNPHRLREREGRCAACGPARQMAGKSTKMEMAKNGTTSSWELHFPLSGSSPGGERAGLSRGGEGTTVRPTITSPRRAPRPWGQGRAAGPAGHPRKVCTDQPLCGTNANHDGGDRSGPLGMWAPLLGSMQN